MPSEECIFETYERVKEYRGEVFDRNLANPRNKGWNGKRIEQICGLKRTGNKGADFKNGELKSIRLVREGGILKVPEPVAIAMVRKKTLIESYTDSNFYAKMHRTLFIFYELVNKGKGIKFVDILLLDLADNNKIYDQIVNDYKYIRDETLKNGGFSTTNGKYIQSRRKGSKNSDTYALYYLVGYVEYIIRKYCPDISNKKDKRKENKEESKKDDNSDKMGNILSKIFEKSKDNFEDFWKKNSVKYMTEIQKILKPPTKISK